MITRLYANNFRCLVAFEAKFDSFGVLCGPNGAGKSSVFDVLKMIRDLATFEAVLGGDGPKDIREFEFTNWLESTIQEFELTVISSGHEFEYKLHVEQARDDVKPRIVSESATCDGRNLFSRDLDGVSFVRAERSTRESTCWPEIGRIDNWSSLGSGWQAQEFRQIEKCQLFGAIVLQIGPEDFLAVGHVRLLPLLDTCRSNFFCDGFSIRVDVVTNQRRCQLAVFTRIRITIGLGHSDHLKTSNTGRITAGTLAATR